ncbi:MAG: hypothetical protein Q4E06_11705 [Lautropia sp.]|nr:hypothetical protein [Lautropia sp.]
MSNTLSARPVAQPVSPGGLGQRPPGGRTVAAGLLATSATPLTTEGAMNVFHSTHSARGGQDRLTSCHIHGRPES